MRFISIGILLFILSGIALGNVMVNDSLQKLKPTNPYIALYTFELEGKSLILSDEKILSNASISKIYQQVNYRPIWGDAKNRWDLFKIIENAYFEGLDQQHYHIDFIRKNIIKLRGKPVSEKTIAMVDIVMTDAILSYSSHLIHGKVNSKTFLSNWNYDHVLSDENVELKLLHHLQSKTLKLCIDSFQSNLVIYKEFKQLFVKYDSINKYGGQLPKINYPGSKLVIGDTLSAVGILKKHLSAYYYPELINNNVFDEDLKIAVTDFQMRNGLEPDGLVGIKTYQAINISLKERLNILRVNMERLRWLNNKLPDNYILVNIASFYLHMVQNQQSSYHCRVVVGKILDPTPVFSSNIKYIVFNPTWNIPYSIASEEILPKLKINKSYLQNRNMVIMSGGETINPFKINFNNYSKNNFPFTIRQEPGYKNSLGLVKFVFPNPYSVYLHDTPSKSLFNKAERAFSHGCIRLEDPIFLAEKLLASQGYDRKKIDKIIAAKDTHTVHLDQEIPIILIYMTCDDNKGNDKITFYRDIYGLDRKILVELRKGK